MLSAAPMISVEQVAQATILRLALLLTIVLMTVVVAIVAGLTAVAMVTNS